MRLIDTESGNFVEFADLEKIPPFAILSHTWDEAGEQTYQEVVEIQQRYRLHPPPKDARSNSRPDDPGVVPQVTLPEVRTTSYAPLSMSPRSPSSYSIFMGMLPLWCALVFSIVHGWLSDTPGQATSSELKPPNHIPTVPTPLSPSARRSIWDLDSGLSEKVRRACEVARRDGYRYIWIDSSCINKESSSELSEAINSMYNWYRGAQVCYAFLVDVPSDKDVRAKDSKFRESKWFKRCWTLQELIAPFVVVFLSRDWEGLGTKDALADVIQEITSIDCGVLTHERALSDESVADRMGWAANRKATRVEDEAYSLLGIFGITMPALYGEGPYAFRRLQEEILQRIPDQSLFAWGHWSMPLQPEPYWCITPQAERLTTDPWTLLAPSPRSFDSSRDRNRMIWATRDSIESLGLPVEEHALTSYGIRTQLRLLPLQVFQDLGLNFQVEDDAESDSGVWYLALLRCHPAGDPQRLLSRLCCLHRGNAGVEFLFVPHWMHLSNDTVQGRSCESVVFTLSLDDLARSKNQLQTKTVYLPHPKPSVAGRRLRDAHDAFKLNLTLPTWARAALRMRGYSISNVQGPTEDDPYSSSFTLVASESKSEIYIHYRYITSGGDNFSFKSEAVMIQARIWILPSAGSSEALQMNGVIRCSPPSASATWVERVPLPMTLPARSLTLVADSGDRVTLWLGLDLTAPSQYNIRVEVAPTSPAAGPGVAAASLRTYLNDLQGVPRSPSKAFNLLLPGSVRRALEVKGYSPRLAHSDPSLGGIYSDDTLTLTCDADSFAIVVRFSYIQIPSRRWMVVVARISVEPSVPDHGSFETVQDGPYVLSWGHITPWRWEGKALDSETGSSVALSTPTGELFALHLAFELAWQFEYYLHGVEIKPRTPRSRSRTERSLAHREWHSPWQWEYQDRPLSLRLSQRAHQSIKLTLPGNVKRALQAQGYQVRFEGSERGCELDDEPVRHLLTLLHISAGVTIIIEYSHRLITRCPEPDADLSTSQLERSYPFLLEDPQPDSSLSAAPIADRETPRKRCHQELTFKASAKASPSQAVAVQTGDITTATADWDAKESSAHAPDHWRYDLMKDITLTLPAGHQLMLRLGFYLAWYSEYCLIVEINPRTPLSRTPSWPNTPPPVPEYERDETGMEHIRRCETRSTESAAGQSAEAHNEALPTDPSTGSDVIPEGSLVCSQLGQDGDGGGGKHLADSKDEEPPVLPEGSEA